MAIASSVLIRVQCLDEEQYWIPGGTACTEDAGSTYTAYTHVLIPGSMIPRVSTSLLLYWSIDLLAWWSVVRSDTPTRDAGGHGVYHVLYRDAVSP